MRWLLLSVLVAGTALANGWGRGGGRVQLGPSWAGGGATHSGGLGPAWGPSTPSWVNTRTGPTPLVPITNHTGGYPQVGYPYGAGFPVYYYVQPAVQQQPPPPQQVIIEREVIVEKAAPVQPAPPPPPPQVIIIEQPAPPPAPVAPPPAPPEPPKPLPPRTPGPDVYSWVDAEGVVNYSTRAPPADGRVKAKKLTTLSK